MADKGIEKLLDDVHNRREDALKNLRTQAGVLKEKTGSKDALIKTLSMSEDLCDHLVELEGDLRRIDSILHAK